MSVYVPKIRFCRKKVVHCGGALSKKRKRVQLYLFNGYRYRKNFNRFEFQVLGAVTSKIFTKICCKIQVHTVINKNKRKILISLKPLEEFHANRSNFRRWSLKGAFALRKNFKIGKCYLTETLEFEFFCHGSFLTFKFLSQLLIQLSFDLF